jgi:hypothetical protein
VEERSYILRKKRNSGKRENTKKDHEKMLMRVGNQQG